MPALHYDVCEEGGADSLQIATNQCLCGDALAALSDVAEAGIKAACVVTSPPYYGQRDYKNPGQIGLEENPEAYIDRLVEVFRLVWRVLDDNGTLWLNIGDCYAGGKGGRCDVDRIYTRPDGTTDRFTQKHDGVRIKRGNGNLKPKDLIGVPWRLAFALQADGWYLRQDIIWQKPNPMPEPVKDRPTRAHEYIFLLSKHRKYYYDNEAVKEPAVCSSLKKFTDNGKDKQRGHSRRHAGFNGRYAEKLAKEGVPQFKNLRDVWTFPPSQLSDAHFAVFPEQLAENCIKAGSRPGDLVLDPFMGSGTVAVVCEKLGRKWLGVEINSEYIEIQKNRLARIDPLLKQAGL